MNTPMPTPRPQRAASTRAKTAIPTAIPGAIPNATPTAQPVAGAARPMLHPALQDVPSSAASDMPDLYTPSEPTRLNPQWVDLLRNRLHAERPQFGDMLLERFIHRVFADNLVLESYFQPKRAHLPHPHLAKPTAGKVVQLIPMQEAQRAARSAQRMDLLRPYERTFAYAAALVRPCGLFYCAHPFVQKSEGSTQVDTHRARELMACLLEDAVRDLSRQHHGKGQAMAAVLGLGSMQGDPEQIARIASAVELSQLRLTDLWVPAQGWADPRTSLS